MKKIMKVILTVLAIVFVLFILYVLAVMPRMIKKPDTSALKKNLYAHRGLFNNESDAPENSMRAFEKAVNAGYGIELDIQLTKDDEIVVCHDFDLLRVCGVDKKIREMTFEELQKLSIYGTDQKIPLFKDVLELVDGRVPLIIEYKLPGLNTKTCKLADEMLADYKGTYCIESFNPMGVRWYKKNRPEIVRGLLADSYTAQPDVYNEFPKPLYWLLQNQLTNFLLRPDFIAYNCKYYDAFSRRLMRKPFGAVAVAWTVESQQELDLIQKEYDMFIFEGFIPN